MDDEAFVHGKRFAAKVEEYLHRRGWVWRNLTDSLNMAASTPHRWKRGEGQPRHETIARIAAGLAQSATEEVSILAALYKAAGVRVPAVNEAEYGQTIRVLQAQDDPAIQEILDLLQRLSEEDRRTVVALLRSMQR